MAGGILSSQCPFMIINSTNVWEAFHEQFLSRGTGKFIPDQVKIFFFFSTLCGMWNLRSMWDLSSPTRGRTWVPCIGRWSLNHWTAGEVPEDFVDMPFQGLISGLGLVDNLKFSGWWRHEDLLSAQCLVAGLLPVPLLAANPTYQKTGCLKSY